MRVIFIFVAPAVGAVNLDHLASFAAKHGVPLSADEARTLHGCAVPRYDSNIEARMTPMLQFDTVCALAQTCESHQDREHVKAMIADRETFAMGGSLQQHSGAGTYVPPLSADEAHAMHRCFVPRYDRTTEAEMPASLNFRVVCDSYNHAESAEHLRFVHGLIDKRAELARQLQFRDVMPLTAEEAKAKYGCFMARYDSKTEAEMPSSMSFDTVCELAKKDGGAEHQVMVATKVFWRSKFEAQ